jgi:hypothetical protein
LNRDQGSGEDAHRDEQEVLNNWQFLSPYSLRLINSADLDKSGWNVVIARLIKARARRLGGCPASQSDLYQGLAGADFSSYPILKVLSISNRASATRHRVRAKHLKHIGP